MCAEGSLSSACPVGCSSVSKDRGFSTRLMWRKNGAIVTYAYYPDKPSSIRCGEDWRWSKSLDSGKWHSIKMWIKLNSGTNKNGEFKAWLDGAQVRMPFLQQNSAVQDTEIMFDKDIPAL